MALATVAVSTACPRRHCRPAPLSAASAPPGPSGSPCQAPPRQREITGASGKASRWSLPRPFFLAGQRAWVARSASDDSEQSPAVVCIPVVDSLTERGMDLLTCLTENPQQFVERVEADLEVLSDGLLDGDQDLPASTSRQQQLALAHDVIYCWMLAEAYKCTGNGAGCNALEREIRSALRRADGELLAEGESRKQQLSEVVLMRNKRGMYKLGAVKYSRSQKEDSTEGGERPGVSDKAREEWLAQQQKTLAMPRQQACVLFSTWARTGYLDRRLEDRAKLDQMVTGMAGSKSRYYQELTNDLIQQATASPDMQTPSPVASELLQIRSQEAFDVMTLHAEELLCLDPNRPVDEFASAIVTDFEAMQRMMEEACRCGRALYDAEQIVNQSFSLPDRPPQP